MKSLLTLLLTSLLFTAPAIAEKPEWAGQGKPTAEQKEAHKAAMQAKESMQAKEDDIDELGERAEKEKKDKQDKLKGLEKQKQKKSEQLQNELDKGSDQGVESRSERKKWWKFWGE